MTICGPQATREWLRARWVARLERGSHSSPSSAVHFFGGVLMSPTRAKLLICDPSASSREVLRELMHDLSIVRIDEASDGGAALSLFQTNPYDLVLCSWDLPYINGLEVLRAIRRAPSGGQTPLVLIRAGLTAKHTVEALEAGANGVLERPFPVAKLCEKVQRIIGALAPVSEQRSEPRGERSWSAPL